MIKTLALLSCLPLLSAAALAKGGTGYSGNAFQSYLGAIQNAVRQYQGDNGRCNQATETYNDYAFSGGQKDLSQINALSGNKTGACSNGGSDEQSIQSACASAQQYLDSHKSSPTHDADQDAKNGACNNYKSGSGGHDWGRNTHGRGTGHGTGIGGGTAGRGGNYGQGPSNGASSRNHHH